MLRRARTPLALAAGVAAALAVLPPAAPPAPPVAVEYAALVGTLEVGSRPASALVLATAAGDVALVPNRFEDVVSSLGGRELEIEGLLLTVDDTPLLWIEAVRVVGEHGERRPVRPTQGRRIAI